MTKVELAKKCAKKINDIAIDLIDGGGYSKEHGVTAYKIWFDPHSEDEPIFRTSPRTITMGKRYMYIGTMEIPSITDMALSYADNFEFANVEYDNGIAEPLLSWAYSLGYDRETMWKDSFEECNVVSQLNGVKEEIREAIYDSARSNLKTVIWERYGYSYTNQSLCAPVADILLQNLLWTDKEAREYAVWAVEMGFEEVGCNSCFADCDCKGCSVHTRYHKWNKTAMAS